jgi:SAM-dependent methyltransferase
MGEAIKQIKELAVGAVAHAKFAHGIELQDGDFASADRILSDELDAGEPSNREMLAACYGAWVGEWAVRHLAATWIGLQEPCAPRLLVAGVTCSPIDALNRFFASPGLQAGLAWMAEQIQAWSLAALPIKVLENNEAAWDRLADDDRFAGELPLPINRESAIAALDPWLVTDWKPGCRLLCLAAGGGRQGPLHAIAGADVTVVDFSQKQLEHDRRIAARHGLLLTTLQCSADRLDILESASFDLVIQPVSACYLPDVRLMYSEVARVLRPGGVYLVQHKQPTSMRLQTSENGKYVLDQLAIEAGPLPIVKADDGVAHPTREPGTIEYAHSLQTLIGELCRAGFLIANFAEPTRADAFAPFGSAEHRACFAPPYFKLKAIR